MYGTGQSTGEVIERRQPVKPVREVNPAFQSQPTRQKTRSVSPEKRAQSPTRVSFEGIVKRSEKNGIKTCLQGFQPGPKIGRLFHHRRWLET